jgi:tRNA threonylcarbamoyladenosine biosynthesis protein TsaB
MRVLAIDTSTPHASVVLWQDGACVVTRSTSEASRHAEHLIALLDETFAVAGWSKREFDVVACCVGPGSFTGVRVGLGTAKGIALALALPIVGVGSLEAMAGAARRTSSSVCVALLEAGKGECYWAAFDGNGACIAGPGHVAARDLASVVTPFAGRDPVIVGDVTSTWDGGGARWIRSPETDRPHGGEIARLAAKRLAEHGADDLHALEPTYVRPPDITWPRATSTTH